MPRWRGPVPLGIDLAAGHARLLACKRTRRGWQVASVAERQWSSEDLGADPLHTFDALAAVLHELVQQSGAGPQVALPLPDHALRRQVLAVPAGLWPWHWRAWLKQQAERLAGAPVQGQAIDVQVLTRHPLTVQLSVCAREVLESWLGLAEAAGLVLVAVDDRMQAMRRGLQALGLLPAGEAACALLEAGAQHCVLHRWRPGQAVQSCELAPLAEQGMDGGLAPAPDVPEARWLLGSALDAERWAVPLSRDAPGDWPVLDLGERLQWADPGERPLDAACYLAAFGLAVRAGA